MYAHVTTTLTPKRMRTHVNCNWQINKKFKKKSGLGGTKARDRAEGGGRQAGAPGRPQVSASSPGQPAHTAARHSRRHVTPQARRLVVGGRGISAAGWGLRRRCVTGEG